MNQPSIRALSCPQCGANVRHDTSNASGETAHAHSLSCEYCGSVLSIAASAPSRSPRPRTQSKRHRCPRCQNKLQRSRLEKGHVSACKRCGGLWIPLKILERMKHSGKKTRRSIAKLNRRRAHKISTLPTNRHQAIDCPECLELMHSQIYQESSTVVVDVCSDHGIWFDEHEMLEATQHRNSGRRGRRYRNDWPSASRWQNAWDAFESNHHDRHDKARWQRRWHRGWRYGPFFIVLSVIVAILDEIFD